MNILIFGGTRFIGLAFLRLCASQGYNVTYLSRRKVSVLTKVDAINGERSDVIGKLKGRIFDAIIDFSAYDAYTVKTALDLINTQTYIFISTSWISQYQQKRRLFSLKESEYIKAKIRAEKQLKNWSGQSKAAIILRFPVVLGRGDHSGRLDYLASRIKKGLPLTVCQGRGENLSFCYVDDVARLIARALSSQPRRSFYLGDALPFGTINYWDLASMVGDCLGMPPRLRYAQEDKIKSEFPSFFDVDPFCQEKSYQIQHSNPFDDFNISTNLYETWLKKCLKSYDPINSELRQNNREYPWEREKFLAEETIWNVV